MDLRHRQGASSFPSTDHIQRPVHGYGQNDHHMLENIGRILANEVSQQQPAESETRGGDKKAEYSSSSSISGICWHTLYSYYFRLFSLCILCLSLLYPVCWLWVCMVYMGYVIGAAIIAALGLLVVPLSLIKYGISLRMTLRRYYSSWRGIEEPERKGPRTQRSRSISPHHANRAWNVSPYRRGSILPTHVEESEEDNEFNEATDYADAESPSINSLVSSGKATDKESSKNIYVADGRYGYPGGSEEPEKEGEIKPPADILLQRWQLPEPVSAELTYLTELIVKGFIDSWYTEFVSEHPKDKKFSDHVRYTLANAMGTLCYNASQRNTLVSLLDTVSDAVQYHLHWFSVMCKRAHKKHPELFEDIPSSGKGEPIPDGQLAATKQPSSSNAKSADLASTDSCKVPLARMQNESSLGSLRSFNGEMGNSAFSSRTGSDAHSTKPNTGQPSGANYCSVRYSCLSSEQKQIKKHELIMNEFASTNVLHKCCNAEDFGCLGLPSSSTMSKKTDEKQMSYLRNISNQLLMHLLPANEIESYGIELILTEVLSSCVLNPLTNLVCPSVCNQVLVDFLRSALQNGSEEDARKQSLQSSQKQERLDTTDKDSQNPAKTRDQNGVTPQELSRMEVSIFAVLSEMFDLSSQSWLRKNIISLSRTVIKLILAQSTIKKAVDFYSRATTPEKVSSILRWFRSTFWPDNTFAVPVAENREDGPSEEEQWEVRQRLLKEIQYNFPVALASVIGKKGSQIGLKKFHEFLQCPVLLKSLTMTVLDCLLQQTFGDLEVYGTRLTLTDEVGDQASPGTTSSEATTGERWSYKGVYNTLKGFVPSFKMRPRRGSIGLREILTHLPGAGPSSTSEGDKQDDTGENVLERPGMGNSSNKDSNTKNTSFFQRGVSRVKSFIGKK